MVEFCSNFGREKGDKEDTGIENDMDISFEDFFDQARPFDPDFVALPVEQQRDVWWQVNLGNSEFLEYAFLDYIQVLKRKKFDSFSHNEKIYRFDSFKECYHIFVADKLIAISWNVCQQDKELGGYKNEHFGMRPAVKFTNLGRDEGIDIEDVFANMETVLKSGDMVLSLSFGVYGYSLLSSPWAFLPEKDYRIEAGNTVGLDYVITPHLKKFTQLCRQELDAIAAIMDECEACFFCVMKAGQKYCANCKIAKYCSKECQTQHWPKHKTICKKK